MPLSVAVLRGGDFIKVRLWDGVPPYPKPTATWANTVSATSTRQLRILHWLQKMLQDNPALSEMPFATAVLRALDLKSAAARRRSSRRGVTTPVTAPPIRSKA